ncbi:hypothetical protein ABEF95_016648 [Exophiala dermatitidis]
MADRFEMGGREDRFHVCHAGLGSGKPRTIRVRFVDVCGPSRLKCDRDMPACGNCVNRGEITACCYVARKVASRPQPQGPSNPSDSAQCRIDHLEQLVLGLLENGQRNQGQTDTPSGRVEVDQHARSENPPMEPYDQDIVGERGSHNNARVTPALPTSRTAFAIGANCKRSTAANEAHWALLLNEISEVRTHLRAQEKRYEEHAKRSAQLLDHSAHDCGPALLFGTGRHLSRAELLAQLPSRYSCDIMVERFWAHLYPAVYILHGPAFNRQYQRFWADQANTSIMWVGLLFAMLRIAMLDYLRAGDEPVELEGKCQDLVVRFRNCFTDCMILGDYLKPQESLIEALCLHLYGEYATSRDVRSSLWVLVGMIVRLAMRMVDHQQTQPNSALTPFKKSLTAVTG